MKVLLVGNGGREHALAWRLAQSPSVEKVFVAPGNGGTDGVFGKVENIPIGSSASDFPALVEFAVKNEIGLVVPGPEQPLVDGIATWFKKVGIPVFGPSAAAAKMEGSKTFSKDFMKKHNIPTAAFENFSDYEAAVAYVNSVHHNVVIKASGLAAGKGVLIPTNKEEALAALKEVMLDKAFGSAGDEVVVEEFLAGNELSILTFSDGYSIFSLPPAQDHKRAGDGDTGLNTGGMGAYAPTPIASAALLKQIDDTIIQPTIDGLRKDGTPFVGMLFTGIMVLPDGTPKVLEFNVRFGDPETQTVLPLLTPDTDLAEVMLACAEGRLDSVKIAVGPQFSTTVVLAAGGYPGSYKKGDVITVDETALKPLGLGQKVFVFHAGTAKTADGSVVTAGGRVLAVTAIGNTIKEAVDLAYAAVEHVKFNGKYNRTDIAHRAFKFQAEAAKGLTYAEAGVSIENGNLLVQQIKQKVKSTARPGTSADIGGFGGLFDLKEAGYTDPLLVGATDGVGSKVVIAQKIGKHDTVGIDLVAMNVNDLVVQGAEPLFFLDYFACGHLEIDVAASFVSGVADGCLQAGCALVGGETSEMPGIYQPGDYDCNGTAVGAVNRGAVLPRTSDMKPGDVLIGLASVGCHSNGYSLVRKVVEKAGLTYFDPAPWAPETSLGEAFLTPTKIYVKQLLPSIKEDLILGMAHITGGGLVENIPRALPNGVVAKIEAGTWPVLPVFKWLANTGNVPVDDLLRTFNLGIGMVLIVESEKAEKVLANVKAAGEEAYVIGRLEAAPTADAKPECVVENVEGKFY